jgi:inosine triphosphate pyrophosphatase
MPEPFKLVFVTGNAYKLSEARIILGPNAQLESVAVDIPETQGTIEQIAIDKCRRAAHIVCFVGSYNLTTDDELSFNGQC